MCLGVPGRIEEIQDRDGLLMGQVDFGGVQREVCLAYVADEVGTGDYAIVHVGFAISLVDEEEAQKTLEILREMGELDEAFGVEGIPVQAWQADEGGNAP